MERKLKLEELSNLTGISKSALGSYEVDDYKEINHGNLGHITHKTWDSILHDIQKAHEHDIDSTPDFSLAKKMAKDIQNALKFPGDHLTKIWKIIFNMLGIDFDKLSVDEQKVLKRVLAKSPVIKNNPLNFRRRRK